jgi:hypothetical protein
VAAAGFELRFLFGKFIYAFPGSTTIHGARLGNKTTKTFEIFDQIFGFFADLVENRPPCGFSFSIMEVDEIEQQFGDAKAVAAGTNGKPAVAGTRYGKNRYSTGAHCPLQWAQPTIEGVALARAQYAVWHSALTRLAVSLRGKLRNVAVMPPISIAAPWDKTVQASR